jgi:diacylglycerol kinase (ATP)
MTIKIIHNPYSARWSSAKRLPELKAALEAHQLDFDLEQTERPGHAIELASQAVQEGYETIVAAGGDGTIGEVVNGIMQGAGDGLLPKFGVLPLGTANDLMCNLHQPLDLHHAVGVIASGHTRLIDLCQVNQRYFINNAGLGFEPFTTTIQEKIHFLHGTFRYLFAALLSIINNPQWHMDLQWDAGEYSGPVTMVSISNGPQTGGVFYTVPHADPFDGKLSFVYGYIPNRLKILQILPRTMKHCTWLKVHVDPATPAHTDGELFDRQIHDLEYRIYPSRVPILMSV